MVIALVEVLPDRARARAPRRRPGATVTDCRAASHSTTFKCECAREGNASIRYQLEHEELAGQKLKAKRAAHIRGGSGLAAIGCPKKRRHIAAIRVDSGAVNVDRSSTSEVSETLY
eukprot:6741349-Pyramimonas_sp.AAC.1